MTKLRKFFASSVMIMTVVVMSGFVAPTTKAAASAGDLIKKDGLSAVYYLGDDGKRYVFPNEATYKSWYSDFSGVVTISSDELSSYPLGGNVVVRPGTFLVKITTDPKVYAVEANGTLRWVQTEADAIALYGTNWAKRVIDVADSFFINYTIGSPLASNEVPFGVLVQKSGESNIYYYDGSNYRLVEDEVAFLANRFQFSNVLTYNNFTPSGSPLTSAEANIIKTSQAGGSGTVVTGSSLKVEKSSATPESQNIPYGSSVEFLKLNLTAANDGAINVTSIKLTSYGLSKSTYIDNVTFYDNGVKVGTSKDINSDGVAIFNFSSPIVVNAGATKTLTVKATIESSQTGSFGLGVASASDVISSAGTISGSFPIQGNLMSSVSSSIGTLTITDFDRSAGAAFGEDDVLLADFTLGANSTEDALVQGISLYNGGTNSDDIVSNLKLYIDGTEVAQGTYANRYATFNLDNYEIEKGDTVSAEVRGDIGVTNTSDTIKFYLKDAADLSAIGKTHGFGLTVSNSFSTVLTTITLNTGDFTIDMDKSSSTGTPARDVKAGDDNVDLATLVLESNSENATVNDLILNLAITGTTTEDFLLENVELSEVGGGTYDLTLATTSASASTLTLDDEISLTKGVAKKFKVRADVLDGIDENITFQVSLDSTTSGNLNIEGDVSSSAITDVIPSTVTGSVITVKAASLDVNTITLTDGTYVGGASNIEVYRAKLKTGTADGVKISSFKLTSATTTLDTNAFTDSNITRLDLYADDVLIKSLSNKITSDDTNGIITFNSLDYSIAADKEVVFTVKATFASTVTAGDFTLSVHATGDVVTRSLDGAKTVTPSVEADAGCRKITIASVGYLNVEMLITASNVNKDSYLLAGSETEAGRYLGELKFTAGNESVKVKTLTLTEQTNTSTDSDIESVKLVDASEKVVAETAVNSDGDAVFSSFNVTFEAKSTSLYVVAKARGINVETDPASTATQGNTAQYKVTALTATGANSGTDLASGNASTAGKYNIHASNHTTKTATIVASKLNSVVDAMGNQTLVGGLNKVIAKYKFVFNDGDNRNTSNEPYKADLTQLKLTIATSSTTSVDDIQAYIEGDPGTITSATSTASGVATINLGTLESVDGEVTLVIIGDITTAGESQYLQSSIADLSADFKYNTSYTGGFISTTFVDGGTLSN